MNKIQYFKLESVGCHIDQNGYVYPTIKNNRPDLSESTHVDNIDDEWFHTLSDEDKRTFNFISISL